MEQQEEEEKVEIILQKKIDRTIELLKLQCGLVDAILVLDEIIAMCCEAKGEKQEEAVLFIYEMALCFRSVSYCFLGCDALSNEDFYKIREREKIFKKCFQIEFPNGFPLAFVISAGEWHRARRACIIKAHGASVKKLYSYENKRDLYVIETLILTLFLVQVLVAVCVEKFSPNSFGLFLIVLIALSGTVGSVCSYGFQALTHELGHFKHSQSSLFFAALATSLANFNWSYYYFNFHNRHHSNTGGYLDRDGDILFNAWHNPPTTTTTTTGRFLTNKVLKYLWSVVYSIFIYFFFCFAKKELDTLHVPSIQHEGIMLLANLVFVSWKFWSGLLYIHLSNAFSLGAFGHPYIHFWIIQHLFIKNRLAVVNKKKKYQELHEFMETYTQIQFFQPTVSFNNNNNGSFGILWDLLNFGELNHVVHHDFPKVCFFRANQITHTIAKEWYEDLCQSEGPFQAFLGWWGDVHWMDTLGDFAGRSYFLDTLEERKTEVTTSNTIRMENFSYPDDYDIVDYENNGFR